MRILPGGPAALMLPALLLAGLTAAGTARAGESRYTDLDLDTCRPGASSETEGPWAEFFCPGVEGWEVRVVEGDLRFHVQPRLIGQVRDAPFETLPSFNTINDKLEWRGEMDGDIFRPYATILRYYTDDGMGAGGSKGNVLVVSRVTPETSCHVSYVDAAATADANAVAQEAADTYARNFYCGVDRPAPYPLGLE